MNVLVKAIKIAEFMGHSYIGTEHYMLAYLIIKKQDWRIIYPFYNFIMTEIGKGSKTCLNGNNCTPSLYRKMLKATSEDDVIKLITEDEYCTATRGLRKIYQSYLF